MATLIEELRSLTKDALNRKEKNAKVKKCAEERKRIDDEKKEKELREEIKNAVDNVSRITKAAARKGQRSATVHNPGVIDGHSYIIRNMTQERFLSTDWDDKVAVAVFKYCLSEGLSTVADYAETGYGQYKGPNVIIVRISW